MPYKDSQVSIDNEKRKSEKKSKAKREKARDALIRAMQGGEALNQHERRSLGYHIDFVEEEEEKEAFWTKEQIAYYWRDKDGLADRWVESNRKGVQKCNQARSDGALAVTGAAVTRAMEGGDELNSGEQHSVRLFLKSRPQDFTTEQFEFFEEFTNDQRNRQRNDQRDPAMLVLGCQLMRDRAASLPDSEATITLLAHAVPSAAAGGLHFCTAMLTDEFTRCAPLPPLFSGLTTLPILAFSPPLMV